MDIKEWLGDNNQLGIDIWNKKYRRNDESFDEWLDRVSGGDASVRKLIEEKKFLFGGRILSNRGLENHGKKVTLSNCYVTTVEDSLESIFETAGKVARTFSYGGGIGVDMSPLAPRGAKVHNSAESSTGAVSFMDLYSLITGLIGQNGRRGALMLSMKCDHPDIEEFIDVKNDLNKVTYANISVRVTDEFMRAVETDSDYKLSYTRPETGEKIEKIVNARKLFRKIAENNWRTGEPGMLFWDRIEEYNLLSNTDEFKYAGINPCAEEPLPNGGACCLGSMNLSEFVKYPFTEDACFDFESFRNAVRVAVAGLNGVLDEGIPLHPLDEQKESVSKWRQIGLGLFGLADMLIKMGIRYGSDESLNVARKVTRTMANEAMIESAILAKEYSPYDAYSYNDVSNTSYFINNADDECKKYVKDYGLRNSQILTIAPTGSISTMLGVSGGAEPVFANSYERTTKTLHGDQDVKYKVFTPIVEEYMGINDVENEEDLPDCFVTAHKIDYKDRIKMQACLQSSIDASISSTVNVPNNFTVNDVEDLYMNAWKMGLKGVTIFRDGCERAGILNTSESSKNASNLDDNINENKLSRGYVKKVNNSAIGLERHLVSGCGSLHCCAFFDRKTGQLLETYLSKGSKGGCLSSLSGLSRMISISARAGVSIEQIIDQLKSSVECPSYAVRRATHRDTSPGNCCPAAVGNALASMNEEIKKMIGAGAIENTSVDDNNTDNNLTCPECGSSLAAEGGCVVCKNCGWSKCN